MKELLLTMALTVDYPGGVTALDHLSLDVRKGEILGLVGQSGCGKSTLALSILKLLHLRNAKATGFIHFQQRDLMLLNERAMRQLRGSQIALVLQSASSALNPVLRIGKQLEEAWNVHWKSDRKARALAIEQTLESVCLPYDDNFLRRLPGEISVGQAQRILIAMATLHRPALLIADEPTSALDAITQAEILKLFADLNQRFGMSILFISHDLLSVASISHRVAVMEQGAIIECRAPADLFSDPRHPYTKRLLAALPTGPARCKPLEPKQEAFAELTGWSEPDVNTLADQSKSRADLQETCP